jgi:D-serine dehydratase
MSRPSTIDRALIDMRTKGIPAETAPFDVASIAAQGWNVLREDMPLPVAVLKQPDLHHNSRWMKQFLEASGAQIAPHGKTTMSPELFDLQLSDGAWGLTLATAHQVQVARSFGYQRIFLANQLVGRAATMAMVAELKRDPSFEFYCLADSTSNVRALSRAVEAAGLARPLNVLVEVGYVGGRTGCRSVDEAMAVAHAISDEKGKLVLAGVEGFEGLLHGKSGMDSKTLVDAFLDEIVAVAMCCEREKLFGHTRPILSAGGSQYYDLVVEKFAAVGLRERFFVLLRSGCYLTHDSSLYRRAFEQLRERNPALAATDGGLRSSLEIWAYVQSRPEPKKAILNFGKRDASHDDPPVALSWYRPGWEMAGPSPIGVGYRVTRLNDQHCYLELPSASPLQVGDMLAFGISHPCLTFDKWRLLYVVDEKYDVVSAVRTYF